MSEPGWAFIAAVALAMSAARIAGAAGRGV